VFYNAMMDRKRVLFKHSAIWQQPAE
jgi:hypothetical protein